ncbi:RdRP-domain-containing protein [Auricularia subglabra TFB-10046 SS5]|nr:RdRP-domain-containing protein [Auricularia subglabra TFB-10046 SS5]
MEIHFKNVNYSATEYDVVDILARALHAPEFQQFSPVGLQLNFQVTLFVRQRTNRSRRDDRTPGHAGNGVLIIPRIDAARRFLQLYGAAPFARPLMLRGRRLYFRPTDNMPPPGLVQELLETVWEDPRVLAERHRRDVELAATTIGVESVQFGWTCRDGVYSVEWESTDWSELRFEDTLRQIVIMPIETDLEDILGGLEFLGVRAAAPRTVRKVQPAVAFRYSHIDLVTLPDRDSGTPSLLFELNVAPSFEIEPNTLGGITELFALSRANERRKRVAFPDELKCPGRYIARWVRVVVRSHDDVTRFLGAAETAGLRNPQRLSYRCEGRGLFSNETLGSIDAWIPTLPQAVAIQVEHLLYEHLLDAREMLEQRRLVERLVETCGSDGAAQVLRAFGAELKTIPWYMDDVQASASVVRDLLNRVITVQGPGNLSGPTNGRVVTKRRNDISTLHVAVSPSSVSITGPIPDRSNRILHAFGNFQEHFIRVAFTDNDGQTFRYDANVDTQALVRSHVLPILQNGFKLGGRLFEYLAYSQSALKQHSVWMVHPFTDTAGRRHSASTIRADMGTFTKDERCPARVGARMSLAFSATEPSGELLSSNRRMEPDIGGDGPACMSDGSGLISIEAMAAVWMEFCRGRSKRTVIRPPPPPSVIQVRVGGAKGTLFVDPMLPGRAVVLRPSMMKFEAGERFNQIEVCMAFTKPSPAYLNRPLIMVLEARGVPKETFLRLQQDVVERTQLATRTLESAAALLESNGLGGPVGLPTLFRRIRQRFSNFPEVDSYVLTQDAFVARTLDFTVNHVLRGLKFRGRIPIPFSWTLVGVPDHHGILNEGEIFVCIREEDISQVEYLEGDVVVSRSPTCHPGDVMIMKAIGRPPAGTAFATERPINCVVFSTKGARSPGSCLGGGDYDGDEYVVTKLPSLRPTKPAGPAMYKNTPRQDIGRPYTMEDIYEFFTNFVINDQLPRIASLWLRIADSSEESVYNEQCMKLAELHSVAVDYPKTGVPVNHSDIPQAPNRIPDWSISELGASDRDRVYRSEKALGYLFRAVSLPAVEEAREEGRAQSSAAKARKQLTLQAAQKELVLNAALRTHPMLPAIEWLIYTTAPLALAGDGSPSVLSDLVQLLNQYCVDLRLICQHNTLSRSRRSQLTEEELVAGTIVARVSSAQFRKREDHMTRMNEQMERLRERICAELAGDDDVQPWQRVQRAFTAWKLSVLDGEFGSSSFGLIALGALLGAVNELEDERRVR